MAFPLQEYMAYWFNFNPVLLTLTIDDHVLPLFFFFPTKNYRPSVNHDTYAVEFLLQFPDKQLMLHKI